MRTVCLAMALFLCNAAVRAEDAAEQPALALQSGGHTAYIHKVLFRPDGKQVVTVSDDHTVRVWDRATGERLAVLRLPITGEGQGMPRAAALAPDGSTLAVGGTPYHVGDKAVATILLIDLDAGAMTAVIPAGDNTITALAFSHDGKRLAMGDASGKATVWDVATRKVALLLEGHKEMIRDAAFSPDDKVLATASADKTARLWSLETGKEACKPMKHDSDVLCLAWHDDNALFTGGCDNVFINKWDRSGKHVRQFVRQAPTRIMAITSLPEKGQMFYTWSDEQDDAGAELRHSGGAVLVFKNDVERDGLTWSNHVGPVCGAVSPDGFVAATSGGDDWGVNLWTLKDGKMVRRLTGRGQTPFWAGWSPDGNSVGWINVKKALPAAAPPPVPRLGPFVKIPVPPPEPPKFDNTLQRSFDLAHLNFGRKPDLTYGRAAHAMGDLRLAKPMPNVLQVLSKSAKKELVCTIALPKGFGLAYTTLAGERVAVGGYNSVNLYNARTGELIRTLHGPAGPAWDLAPSPDGRYLLAAFADQILRVYDLDKDAPLLSLFVAGSDWVAWTKEGYYAASPGGEKLMGWQVNHGLDQLATFYPAEQFHDSLYRPDVIRRVLAEGSVEKAVAAADKESGKTTAANGPLALPPGVRILTPAAGKLDQAEVEVKAEATGKDHPIVTMHLLMDGRPCPGAEAATFPKAKPGDKQEATWKATVPDGEHHFAVLAETDASLGASPEVVVTWQAAAQEPLPTLYVLAVGINAYPGSLKLTWAVDDATAIQKAFQDGGAPKPYGKVETNLLTDGKATKDGILAGLDWLKTKMTPDDTAVVFYAGHGHRDKKTSQFYMLPSDVDVADLPRTGVTGTQIKEKLKVVPGKVLVLLDACHSGSIGNAPADPGSLTDDVQRQLAAPDCGVVILCAAMAQEEAGEAAAVQHGFFTEALLQGLAGEAPQGKDGLIHLTALDYYVEEAVAELSKEEQHVVIDRPSTVTSFPLVKPPAKAEEK